MWLHPLLACGMEPPTRIGRRQARAFRRRANRRIKRLVARRNRHRGPGQPKFDVPTVKRMLRGVIGAAIARAQELTGVEVYAFVIMSNHLHLVLRTPKKNLALFMRHLKAFATTRINQITGRTGTMWHGRYNAQPVLTDEAACERIGYTIGNPVSANLVSRPEEWPSLNLAYGFADASLSCVEARPDADVLTFEYFSATAWHRALMGEKMNISKFIYERKLTVLPLPPFAHLSRAEYKRAVNAWVRASVERQRALQEQVSYSPAHATRAPTVVVGAKKKSEKPLGVKGVIDKDFTDRPDNPKRSRRPHAYGDPATVGAYISDKAWVTVLYESASERYRAGERDVEFPPGTYPPLLPCTEAPAPARRVA